MQRNGQADGPRIAALVDTATTWGRQIATGIQNFARTHGPWQTFIDPRGTEEPMRVPPGWQGDGVIARVGSRPMARQLRTLGLPVVNVSGIHLPDADFPRVTTDLEASGRMAADYFLQRGYRSFGYFSLTGLQYVAVQRKAFAGAVAAAGCPCAVYAVRPHHGAEPNWNLDLARVGEWLASLPKPAAILTWNYSSSREVLYACPTAGLRVPEDVAILCGSDDELLCELSHIPLSGIRTPAEQIGHRAAEMLDQLMRGVQPERTVLSIPPLGITTRQSTDTLAIRDPALLRAVSFIRENAARDIKIVDVARHAGVSRRLLENRFTSELRRTPGDELRHVRIERAKELLHRTDRPIPEVAELAGFGSPEYLSFIFRRELNTTPLRYRRNVRAR